MFKSARSVVFLPVIATIVGCSGSQSAAPVTTAALASRGATAFVAAPTTGTYWSGTVSAISGDRITANCGQSNFAAEYGCIPVATAGAVVSGIPVVGQYFQLWGDLSNLPNVKATTIRYSSTQFPTIDPGLAAPHAPVTAPTEGTPVGTMPAGTYWSGTVSAVDGNRITANCGQSNFAAEYGCIPVATAGAVVSGVPVVGQYFQLWGDLSNLPNVTATTIRYGSTKFPTTPGPVPPLAPPGTPSPTTVPSASSVASLGTVPSGTYYSGTISAVYGTNLTVNCGKSNFAQGFGCLPVTTAGAVVSGIPVVGTYFQLWGDLSKLPAIRAYTINYSRVPYSATAPVVAANATPGPVRPSAPLPAPTSKPSSVPIGGAFNTNGVAWPKDFRPYNNSTVWSSPLPTLPKLQSNSAAIVSAIFPGAGNGFPVRSQEPGMYDYTHAVYFATNSDPAVNFSCSGAGCTTSGLQARPAVLHVPSYAKPAESTGNGAGDSHMAIVQPDGSEVDAYGWNGGSQPSYNQPPSGGWTTGTSFGIGGSGFSCPGGFYNGTGMQVYSGDFGFDTAGGACEGAGSLSPAQLISGVINHALFMITNCANGNVYPSPTAAQTNPCSGIGPALGSRLWYDVPDATTNANPGLRPWEKAILNSWHDYGFYVMDDVGGGWIGQGVQFVPESEENVYLNHGADPWAPLAGQGWSSITIPGVSSAYPRWVGADPWQPSGVNLNGHMHVIDPCVTARTC